MKTRIQARPSPRKDAISVKALREGFGLNRRLFARLAGFSERAIAGWEGDGRQSSSSRQRLRELQRLQRALADVMEPSRIGEWLQTPGEAFDGLKPLEVIERGEVDRLWRMIFYLESGTPM